MELTFKEEEEDRLRDEFDEIDPTLRCAILFLKGALEYLSGDLFNSGYDIEFCITTLLRTQEEQDEAYKGSLEYQEKPWTSFHQSGLAVDIRYAPFTFDMWADALVYAERVFKHFGFNPVLHTPDDTRRAPHCHIEIQRPFKGVF